MDLMKNLNVNLLRVNLSQWWRKCWPLDDEKNKIWNFFLQTKPGLDNKSEFLLHPIKFCHSLFSKKSPQETEKSCDMNANPLKTILPDDSFTEKSFVLKSGFFLDQHLFSLIFFWKEILLLFFECSNSWNFCEKACARISDWSRECINEFVWILFCLRHQNSISPPLFLLTYFRALLPIFWCQMYFFYCLFYFFFLFPVLPPLNKLAFLLITRCIICFCSKCVIMKTKSSPLPPP